MSYSKFTVGTINLAAVSMDMYWTIRKILVTALLQHEEQGINIDVISRFHEPNEASVEIDIRGVNLYFLKRDPLFMTFGLQTKSVETKELSTDNCKVILNTLSSSSQFEDCNQKVELDLCVLALLFNDHLDISFHNMSKCYHLNFDSPSDRPDCYRYLVLVKKALFEVDAFENDCNSSTSFTFQTLPSFSMTELETCVTLIPTTPSERTPLFRCLIFDPFGLPITCNNVNSMLKTWETQGIYLNDCTVAEILQPHYVKEINFTRKADSCDLVMIIKFSEDGSKPLEKKVELSLLIQKHINELMMLNETQMSEAATLVLKESLVNRKLIARQQKMEMSIHNTVDAFFEIVTHSTNNIFRNTCFSLLNSVTSHGFKSDLYDALQRCINEKQDAKKRKRSTKEEWEWELLEKSSQTILDK